MEKIQWENEKDEYIYSGKVGARESVQERERERENRKKEEWNL